jgi:hypothetical protein
LIISERFENGVNKPDLAIGSDDLVPDFSGLVSRTDNAGAFQNLFAILRVDAVHESRKVCGRIIRHAKNPAILIGPIADSGFDVKLPTPDLGEALRILELGLASPQSLFALTKLLFRPRAFYQICG